jgi:hypothetical protein
MALFVYASPSSGAPRPRHLVAGQPLKINQSLNSLPTLWGKQRRACKKTPISSYRSATSGATLGHNADTFMTTEGFFLRSPRFFHPPQQ